MGFVTWILAPFRALRALMTPPRVASTDGDLAEAEREIDELHDAVARARRFLGLGLYCLGAGGKDPHADDPWSKCAHPDKHTHEHKGRVFCDCSGFVDWCYEWTRNDPVYGWRYTDAFVRDAARDVPGDLGYAVALEDCKEGDLVVYRSVDIDGDGDRDRVGHVGIISKRARTWHELRVIHCSASGSVAVKETDGMIWAKRGVVFRVRRQ